MQRKGDESGKVDECETIKLEDGEEAAAASDSNIAADENEDEE